MRAMRHLVTRGVTNCHVVDLMDFDFTLLQQDNTLVILIMATYGDGEPTDNARDFHDKLMTSSDQLGTKYAIFGLGNSTYAQYNKAALQVDA